MTIGIAAYGPKAGAAVLQALAAAEKICTGAIGGFVAAACVFEDSVVRGETQCAGVTGLQFSTSRQEFESAVTAGLISSGPNRPVPLSAFVTAKAGTGVVTGHRMPNAVGVDGIPMNLAVLNLIADGTDPGRAVNEIVNANPDADCGLIAVNVAGSGGVANTLCVSRPDAGMASGQRGDASVWVLHNAVRPFETLAPLLVEIALDVMRPAVTATGHVLFKEGCLVEAGESPQIHVDESGTVKKIVVGLSANREAQALDIGCQPLIYLHSKPIARLIYEPLLMVRDNRLISADGDSALQVAIGVRSNDESLQ